MICGQCGEEIDASYCCDIVEQLLKERDEALQSLRDANAKADIITLAAKRILTRKTHQNYALEEDDEDIDLKFKWACEEAAEILERGK